MKKSKKLLMRAMFVLLFAGILISGMNVKKVQAAVSYNKAVTLYNNVVIHQWAKKGTTIKIVDDLRNNGCWTSNETGKRVSMRPLYGGYLRYFFKDVNGDKTIEAFFFYKKYIYIFTIRGGKVKAVGAIRTTEDTAPELRFNSKKKIFSFSELVTIRSYTAKAYKLNKTKLSRVCTLGDYIAPQDSTGRNNYTCWLNKKKVSDNTFRKYKKTYVTSGKKYHWGP